MANNKSYFSIFADDFKLMKTELSAEEILDMMSALSDMCMWGETDYKPTSAKQIYFWEKLKGKFDCDSDIYKKKSEAGKIGMHNRWHNKTDNTNDNKSDNKKYNTIHNKRDNHLTPNTLTPNSITPIYPPVSKDTSPQRVEQLHFGTLKNVILTEKQYSELKEKHPNLDDGIEELDTWLGKNSKSAKEARGKNHYAYFKSNSWVWERVGNLKPTEKSNVADEDSNLSKEERFQLFLKRCGVSEAGGTV